MTSIFDGYEAVDEETTSLLRLLHKRFIDDSVRPPLADRFYRQGLTSNRWEGFWKEKHNENASANTNNKSYEENREEWKQLETKLKELKESAEDKEGKDDGDKDTTSKEDRIAKLQLDMIAFAVVELQDLKLAKTVLENNDKPTTGTSEEVANLIQVIGQVLADLEEFPAAMDSFFHALDLRQNLFGNDRECVAETFFAMGYVLYKQGEFDQACDCIWESLSIRKKLISTTNENNSTAEVLRVADAAHLLGMIELKRKEYNEAQKYLMGEAFKLRKSVSNLSGMAETLLELGKVHCIKKEMELAKECFEECIRLRRSATAILEDTAESDDDNNSAQQQNDAKQQLELALALQQIGDCYSTLSLDNDKEILSVDTNKEFLTQAQEHYKEALEIRRQVLKQDHMPPIKETLVAQADLLAKMGNAKEALAAYKEASSNIFHQYVSLKTALMHIKTGTNNSSTNAAKDAMECLEEYGSAREAEKKEGEEEDLQYFVALVTAGALQEVLGNDPKESKENYNMASKVDISSFGFDADTKDAYDKWLTTVTGITGFFHGMKRSLFGGSKGTTTTKN